MRAKSSRHLHLKRRKFLPGKIQVQRAERKHSLQQGTKAQRGSESHGRSHSEEEVAEVKAPSMKHWILSTEI